MDKKAFYHAVERGLASAHWNQLDKWITRESSYTFDLGPKVSNFDDDIFDKLVSLLKERSFIYSDNSSSVLMIFEYDWSLFSMEQRQKLLTPMVDIFEKLNDPLSWFVVMELLGEYYADAEALEALKALKQTVLNNGPRSLIPMGFEKLIKYSSSEAVKASALAELKGMRSDVSEQVRMEVEISFDRLSN